MSTNRTRTPLPQLAGTIVVGVGFVLLTLTVLVAMHVLTGRLLTEGGAQGRSADAVELRVPSHEMDAILVPGRAAAPETMEA